MDQPEGHRTIAADRFSPGCLNAVLHGFTGASYAGIGKPLLHPRHGSHQQKAKNDQSDDHFDQSEAMGAAGGSQHVDPVVSQQLALTVAPLNLVVVLSPFWSMAYQLFVAAPFAPFATNVKV